MRIGKGIGIAGTIAAVIGLAGCAAKEVRQEERVIPIYNPPREVVQEFEGITAYKEVWSDARTLKVSLYIELDDGTRMIESSWERHELKYSGACAKKAISLRLPDVYNGQEGWIDTSIEDAGCDLLELKCSGTFTAVDGTTQDVSAEVCAVPHGSSLADILTYVEQGLSENAYDLEEQTRLWHERKGVKHAE